MGWNDIIEGYRNQTDVTIRKQKQAKSQISIVVLLLSYLALGKDYPYNIAKTFCNSEKDYRKKDEFDQRFTKSKPRLFNIPGYSILLSESKLSGLLKRMERDGLILRVSDANDREHCYKLNPKLIIDSIINDIDYDNLKDFEKPNEDELKEEIEKFLKSLNDYYSENKGKKVKDIKFIGEKDAYDYYDFIEFLIIEYTKIEMLDKYHQGSININLPVLMGKCIPLEQILEDIIKLKNSYNFHSNSLKIKQRQLRNEL